MIRESHMRRIWVLVCVLSVLIIFLSPTGVAAEKNEAFGPAPFDIEMDFSYELNLMRNGDTRIYSPSDRPTIADEAGREENEELVNRNFIRMFFKSDTAEVLLNVYSLHSYFLRKPKSIGLEGYVVFPMSFVSPRLRLGVYHDSAHILDNGLYGNTGTDFTALHARFLVVDKPNKFLDVWFTNSGKKNRKAPYYITEDATDFKQTELGRIKMILGAEARLIFPRSERFVLKAESVLFFGNDKKTLSMPSSVSFKALLEYRLYSNVSLGSFFEYRRNFQLEDKIGKEELFLGPTIRFSF